MDTDIETSVRDVITRVSHVDVSSLGRDDDLVEHLGVDSLQGLQILAGVEKRFDVRLPDDELITLRTIGRIQAAIQAAGGGLRAADGGLQAADGGLRAADGGLRAADGGLRAAGEGLQAADGGLQAAGPKF
jgi:acyl carrier protein